MKVVVRTSAEWARSHENRRRGGITEAAWDPDLGERQAPVESRGSGHEARDARKKGDAACKVVVFSSSTF